MLVLNAADVREALPMAPAIEAMKRAFAALSAGRAQVPQRAHLPELLSLLTDSVRQFPLAFGGRGATTIRSRRCWPAGSAGVKWEITG